jgi:tRNA (guanine-N7-)-methyltransferase
LAADDPSLPPSLLIPVPDVDHALEWNRFFDPSRPVELDVGCGKGRFVLARARAFPETQFLGIEREDARVARIDLVARREGLRNIHVLKTDAMVALTQHLPTGAADAIYFFFPDPWPKRKHHKRRLFTPLFLDAVHRVLKPGGCMHVATDRPDYFDVMRRCLDADARFAEIEAFTRKPEEQTDFELIFRGLNLLIGEASYRRV